MLERSSCVSDKQLVVPTCNERAVRTHKCKPVVDKRADSLSGQLIIAGIPMILTYEDKHDYLCIAFPHPEAARRFLNIVGRRFNPRCNSIYQRMRRSHLEWGEVVERCWKYKVHLIDSGIKDVFCEQECYFHKQIGPADFELAVYVWFPSSDYREVMRRLKCHNRATK